MKAFSDAKAFFESGATLSAEARLRALQSLYQVLKQGEGELLEALQADLGKPEFEAFLGEIGFLYEELHFCRKHLRDWMRPERVKTPLTLFPAKSEIRREPKGPVLVLAPWNYPVQLAVAPAIAAISAGNTVVLKPSELAPASADAMKKLLAAPELRGWIQVVTGDAGLAQELLRQPFRHVFFTGGERVGILVMKAAAEHLADVTLELGGKSPVLVHASADLRLAARKIVWGKFFNAGQTCVAPDYAVVDKKVHDEFLRALKSELERNFGTEADYGRIIHRRHFERLEALAKDGELLWGGKKDPERLHFGPTVVRPKSLDAPLMREEIFGPILPVIAADGEKEMHAIVARNPEPLALYAFGRDTGFRERALATRAGGVCWNDVVVHLGNPHLPFGGAGKSGIGAYHGRHGFAEFSHKKAVILGGERVDPPLRYRPYAKNLKWIRKLIK